MTKSVKFYLVILLLATSLTLKAYVYGESVKLATLAPKNSSWGKIFDSMARELEKESNGELKLQIFYDGVQGDEIDVIQKIRAGLLHAGAMTSVGLGEIQKSALIFQTPRLFNSYAELDHVRDRLKGQLNKEFEEVGYVLLGWGDIGYYYIFSNYPTKSPEDLRHPSVKMWIRLDDSVFINLYKIIGGVGVPLSVPQVLPALNTGQVNSLIVSPLACIALQWYPKLKYMTDVPMAIGVGATVITKKKYDSLTPQSQKLLKETAQKYHLDLVRQVRQDNDKSFEALKKFGIKVASTSDIEMKQWDKISIQSRHELAGKIYPTKLLEQVNELIEEYRTSATNTKR